jgi:hypothetical protein
VGLFPQPVTVWHAVQPPPAVGVTTGATDVDYIDWWTAGLVSHDTKVSAVLGFCAGGVFASALADAHADRLGYRPMTLLLNPGRPSRVSVERDFRGAVASLSPLTAEEKASAVCDSEAITAAWGDNPGAVFDQLGELYGRVCRQACERAEIAADVADELVAVFGSYTVYLRHALALAPSPTWGQATGVLSVDAESDPLFRLPLIATTSTRRDLLRNQDVANDVFTLLAMEEADTNAHALANRGRLVPQTGGDIS